MNFLRKLMRKLIVVCGLLAFFVTSSPAQTQNSSWLRGPWEGTGYQTDDHSTWTMKLNLRTRRNATRVFSIEYPSLKCGGEWKLVELTARRARFRERLSHGQTQCADNGNVVIERIGQGQLMFLYANQGSRVITASAILNRASRKG